MVYSLLNRLSIKKFKIMKDISGQQLIRILEERLKLSNQLKKENTDLYQQIKKLSQKLLESEKFKSHFISNVTNEIINPFSSVMGLSKSIMALKGDQMGKARELAGLIYSESSFLDFQLSNIFVAAQMESGEITTEISNIDVARLIEEVVESFRPESDGKQIMVHTELHVNNMQKVLYFKNDREKIRLILVNLLSNAIKFSNKNKNVNITAHIEDSFLIVCIQDEGIGLSKEDIEKIFDRFHRAEKKIHSLNPGNGLGLSVVDGLVNILNGKISVNSFYGNGSEFIVKIPEATQDENLFDEDGLFFREGEGEESF